MQDNNRATWHPARIMTTIPRAASLLWILAGFAASCGGTSDLPLMGEGGSGSGEGGGKGGGGRAGGGSGGSAAGASGLAGRAGGSGAGGTSSGGTAGGTSKGGSAGAASGGSGGVSAVDAAIDSPIRDAGPADVAGPPPIDARLFADSTGGSDVAATAPVCLAAVMAGASCDVTTAKECSLAGGQICACISRCSGVPPPPGLTHAWACALPPPADCPVAVPQNGVSCAVGPGTRCQYGTCGGSTAVCEAGRWKVTFIPPPP